MREGEQVRYRVDLTTMPYGATNATVWDVLPVGFTKSSVSNITDSGVAYDPTDAGYPAGMDPTLNTRSVVVWTGVDVPYDSGVMMARKTLNYTVTIPVGTSVATTHDNDASIISYAASINTSGLPNSQVYYPTDSYNVALGPTGTDEWNTPGTYTRDDSSVYLPSASIAKTATSEFDSGNSANNAANQIVKGEVGEFIYTVTVPAYTSITNGLLSDDLTSSATNWLIDPTLTTVDYPGGSTAPGFDGTFTVGSTPGFDINANVGTLDFPSLYTNSTASDQTFTVHLFALVQGDSSWGNNTFRADEATFESGTQSDIVADSGLTVITPNPSVLKSASPTSVTAGQTVTYTLTARNNSSNSRPTLFDAQMVDCVPAELTGVTLGSASQGSASIVPDVSCSGTRIVWDIGALLSGSANYETLTYSVTVSPASAGNASYTNTARLTGYSLDDPGADRATQTASRLEEVTVLGAGLVKSVSPGAATIGQEVTYSVVATVPADVNFYDTALIDDVPSELAISGATLTCEFAGGGDCLAPLQLLDANAGDALTASGTLQGWWLGDIPSNSLARTFTLTYTGTVLDVAANTTGHAIVNDATLRWNITNTASAPPANANYSTDETTPVASATLHVIQPSTSVVKHVNGLDSDTVAPGDTFTYTVTVTNPSGTYASTANQVTVTDVVPTNVIVKETTISGGGSLTGESATTGGGTITWNLASLDPGTANAVTFTYDAELADSTYLDASTLTNDATVTGFTSHPTSTAGYNDLIIRSYSGPTADADVTPDFPSPTIVKTAAAGPAYIGEAKSFTITVTNDGTSDARNAEVTDTLPANWIYDAGSTTIDTVAAGDPTIAGQVLTWSSLPDLVPTDSFTITYTAHPDASVTWTGANTGSAVDYTNNATVTVDDVSGSNGNLDGVYTDSTSETVHIDKADLIVDKAHTVGVDPTAGAAFSWTLTVTNSAISDTAVGPIVVDDTLPVDAIYVSYTGTGWTADTVTSPGHVIFTHAGPLVAGGALPVITVNVTLPDDLVVGTDFTNVATVEAKTFDPYLPNNSDSDPASTLSIADVELVKTSVGGPFTSGDYITWDLDVTNNGPSIAFGPFEVTDSLPATVDWSTVTATGPGWTCDPVTVGGDVVCTSSASVLAVAGSLPTITISARILPSTIGDIDNTATVTHPKPDPEPREQHGCHHRYRGNERRPGAHQVHGVRRYPGERNRTVPDRGHE